ncbi:MAG: trypsin-like serine protease [Bacteriovoracia bacterium]
MQRFALTLALIAFFLNVARAEEGNSLRRGFDKSVVPSFSGIFSGTPVAKNAWGWGSTVFVKLSGGTCTGTLISPTYVLTAAHCAIVTPEFVAFFDGEKLVAKRKVIAWKIHPNYTPEPQRFEDNNDIAVLRLESAAPAPFTPVPMLKDVTQLAGTVVLQGFGKTGVGLHNGLTSANLQVQARDEKNFIVQMGDVEGKQSGCVGDSGGPAYIKIANQYYLAAVSSYIDADNMSCDGGGHHTFSIIVVNYLSWIHAVMENGAR